LVSQSDNAIINSTENFRMELKFMSLFLFQKSSYLFMNITAQCIGYTNKAIPASLTTNYVICILGATIKIFTT